MTDQHKTTDLGAAVRTAILRDMEATEVYHYSRMEEHRAAGKWDLADQQQRMAELVRACIVVAQAAASSVIESHEKMQPPRK